MRVRVAKNPLTIRAGLGLLALVWLGSGCFLFVAWRSDADGRAMREAPQCAPDQVFTTAKCRIDRPGTIVELTRKRVVVDVDGHRLVMEGLLAKLDHPEMPGSAARVTLYGGRPVSLDVVEPGVTQLRVVAADRPGDDRQGFGFLGLAFFVVGTVTMIVKIVLDRGRRRGRAFAPR